MIPAATCAALPIVALHLYFIFSRSRFERALLLLFAGVTGIGGSLGFISLMFLRRRPHVADSALKWAVLGAIGLLVALYIVYSVSRADDATEEREIGDRAIEELHQRVRPIRANKGDWQTEWSAERNDWRLKDTDLYFGDIITGLQAGMTIDEIASVHQANPAHIVGALGDMHSVMFDFKFRMEGVTDRLKESIDVLEATSGKVNRIHLIGMGLVVLGILMFTLLIIQR